jgi:hypothetical protein
MFNKGTRGITLQAGKPWSEARAGMARVFLMQVKDFAAPGQ